MTKTFTYLLLVLELTARLARQGIVLDSLQKYVPEMIENLMEFVKPDDIDLIDIADRIAIISEAQRVRVGVSRSIICLSKDEYFEVLDTTEFCFDIYKVSRITEALCVIYMKAKGYSNSTESTNLTSLAVLSHQTHMFQQIDYVLIWKCIKSIMLVIDDTYRTVFENLLNSRYAPFSLLQILESIFANTHTLSKSFVVTNSDLVLMVWSPFENISGVALYEDLNNENHHWFKIIYSNETSEDIHFEHLKIAGYIPSTFFRKQFAHKQNHMIIVVLIVNGPNGKYINRVLDLHNGVSNYIGIGMPGECKKNYEPLLKAFFRSEGTNDTNEWIEFGKDYFDSLTDYDWYTCTLSQMTYFGKIPVSYKRTSVKINKNCLETEKNKVMHYFPIYRYQGIYSKKVHFKEIALSKIVKSLKLQSLHYRTKVKQGVSALLWGKRTVLEKLRKQIPRFYKIFYAGREDICLLNSIYNHVHTSNRTHFETAKEEYCMERFEANGLKWRQMPIYNEIYPENLCLDRHLYLPSKYCYENGLLEEAAALGAYKECLIEHPITESTEALYQKLIQCRYQSDMCGDSIATFENISSYVDVALLLKFFSDTKNKDAHIYLNLFEHGLLLVGIEAKRKDQLRFISSFMFFFFNLPTIDDVFEIKEGFIYLTLTPFSMGRCGWLFFKQGDSAFLDYVAVPISFENATQSYSSEENLEVAFYLDCQYSVNCTSNETSIDTFIIYSNNFTLNEGDSCKTRIIAFLNKGTIYDDFNISVFLRNVEETDASAYDKKWSTISLKYGELAVVSITQQQSVCYSPRKLSIFRMNLVRQNDSQENVEIEMSRTLMDLISQLVVSVNVETQELHDEHSPILQVITFTISLLSMIGLAFVTLSTLTIRDWYKRRFCSIQLTIVTICETFFFLIDTKHFSYIGYIIFYYFMLAQFAWMVVIGYIQYTKFVKVFKTSELGILRPMIVGWLVPLTIALAMLSSNLECMKCNLCRNNGDIFMYFVLIPISVVIVANFIIYVMVMINLLKTQFQLSPEAKKARTRAAIMLPFMLGISWISILAILAPWSWMSMIGSYLFHIIAPSQGLILFVFLVILDKGTMVKWRNRYMSLWPRNVLKPSIAK